MEISKEFKEGLFKILIARLGYDKMSVMFTTEEKNNRHYEPAVMICNNGNGHKVIFPLTRFYKGYCEKTQSLNSIAEAMIMEFNNTDKLQKKMRTADDYQSVKDKVRIRLINAERNCSRLERMPNIPYLDLAAVFYLYLGESYGRKKSLEINYDLLAIWGKSTEEIFADALENMQKESLPPKPMWKVFKELLQDSIRGGDTKQAVLKAKFYSEQSNQIQMYLLTNQDNFYGACRLLDIGALQKFSEQFNCSFYLIPSSVHEILMIPEDVIKPEEIGQIVSEVNYSQVNEEERLSNAVYLFDKETAFTRIVKEGKPL